MYANKNRRRRPITATHWNGTSWSNGLPDALNDVYIDSNYTTATGSFSCRDLIITNDSVLTIISDSHVKVLRDITQDPTSKIIVKNKGNLMLLHKDANVATAKVQVEATFPNHQLLNYEFLSFPISGVTLKSTSPGTLDGRFYTYNEQLDDYVSVNPHTTVTQPGRGYMIRVPNNFPTTLSDWNLVLNNFTSGNVNNGIIHLPITKISEGFNMIGNPYSTAINLTKFCIRNQNVVETSIFFWKKTNGAQGSSYYNFNSRTNNICTQFLNVDSLQGFIVKKQHPHPPNDIVFTPEMMLPSEDYSAPDRIYINLKQVGIFHPIGGFCYDIKKFPIPFEDVIQDGAISLTDNGNKIICRKETFQITDELIIRVFFEIAANYTITLRQHFGLFQNIQNIFLIDQLLDITHNLKTSDYNFSSTAGEFLDRFKIVFQQE